MIFKKTDRSADPAHQHRRTAAAVVCAERRHEPGRAPPATGQRGCPLHHDGPPASDGHTRPDMHLAGQRPLGSAICATGADGHRLHPATLDIHRRQADCQNPSRRGSWPRRLLITGALQ